MNAKNSSSIIEKTFPSNNKIKNSLQKEGDCPTNKK